MAEQSRHAKLADDSARLCVVVTDAMFADIKAIAAMRGVSRSHVIREMINIGIERSKTKWQVNQG